MLKKLDINSSCRSLLLFKNNTKKKNIILGVNTIISQLIASIAFQKYNWYFEDVIYRGKEIINFKKL